MGANDNRHAPIPFPGGRISSNEDEAAWLEKTLQMRFNETLARAGIPVKIKMIGLYDLLLLALNAASRRRITPTTPTTEPHDG